MMKIIVTFQETAWILEALRSMYTNWKKLKPHSLHSDVFPIIKLKKLIDQLENDDEYRRIMKEEYKGDKEC